MVTEDLEYVRQFDPYIDYKYIDFKRQNESFAEHFLKEERKYWEIEGEGGKYAPEIID